MASSLGVILDNFIIPSRLSCIYLFNQGFNEEIRDNVLLWVKQVHFKVQLIHLG